MKRRRLLVLIALSCLILLGGALILRLRKPKLYTVTELPTLGGAFTLPCAINDRGQVAGFSEVTKGTYHLFLWDRENGMRDLGPVLNGHVHMNNVGQIAATMQDPDGRERAFIWDADRGRRILPTLGGKRAEAHAINNLGQVVGASEMADGVLHACVWDGTDNTRDLTPSYKGRTWAWAINDAGQTIVIGIVAGPRLVDVNEGLTSTSPVIPVRGLTGVNKGGCVAGLVPTGARTCDVVTWHVDRDLETIAQRRVDLLGTDSSGTATINDVGQVLFHGIPQRTELFDYQFPATPTKNYLHDPNLGQLLLNRYVAFGSREDLCLMDLNNHGCIVGAVQSTRESISRGVLLEPIPERWGR